MTPRLPHSPPGAPHPCEVAVVLEGPHPTRGMRQEPVSPCSSSFLRGKTSATVWGGCQGGGKPQVSGRWLWPMAHLAGDYVKVAAHPPVNIPPGSLGATGTHRTPPVENKEGLLKAATESGVTSASSSSTVERRRREVQGQSPVLSQFEQELPPSRLRSSPIVKWTLGPGAGPPPPILIFALPPPGLCPWQQKLVQNQAEKLWG